MSAAAMITFHQPALRQNRAMSLPLRSGKKYLSVRCNSPDCDNMLIYAELPDHMALDAQDSLEQQYRGKLVHCSRCHQQTRVYEGLTVLIR